MVGLAAVWCFFSSVISRYFLHHCVVGLKPPPPILPLPLGVLLIKAVTHIYVDMLLPPFVL
jgi:hypothetical protein